MFRNSKRALDGWYLQCWLEANKSRICSLPPHSAKITGPFIGSGTITVWYSSTISFCLSGESVFESFSGLPVSVSCTSSTVWSAELWFWSDELFSSGFDLVCNWLVVAFVLCSVIGSLCAVVGSDVVPRTSGLSQVTSGQSKVTLIYF